MPQEIARFLALAAFFASKGSQTAGTEFDLIDDGESIVWDSVVDCRPGDLGYPHNLLATSFTGSIFGDGEHFLAIVSGRKQ